MWFGLPFITKAGVSLLSFSVRRFCNTRNKKEWNQLTPITICLDTIPPCRRNSPIYTNYGRSSLQPFTFCYFEFCRFSDWWSSIALLYVCHRIDPKTRRMPCGKQHDKDSANRAKYKIKYEVFILIPEMPPIFDTKYQREKLFSKTARCELDFFWLQK